jgi:hypothetical protein
MYLARGSPLSIKYICHGNILGFGTFLENHASKWYIKYLPNFHKACRYRQAFLTG